MFSEQTNQPNEYLYSLVMIIIISSILLSCIIGFYISYARLQSKYKRIKHDFADSSERKKEILELLNFQQTSVTHIGNAIQSIVSAEFEQQSLSLFKSNEMHDRRVIKKQNWQKVLELAERLARFTLRNEQRDRLAFAVSSQRVFDDNQLMLNALLNVRQQSLILGSQSHCILNMPKGALDKILRGAVLQTSKAVDPQTTLSLQCDSTPSHFNFSITGWGGGITRTEIQNIAISVRTNPRFHFAKRAQDNEGDLNLASIHRLVAQFGGTVKLVSALEYATVMYISLPRTIMHGDADHLRQLSLEANETSAEHKVTAPLTIRGKLSQPKVLIIDQNNNSQMILHRALQTKYQCFACKSPLETLQMIHNVEPALIIIEQTLSDIEPLELLKLIRATASAQNTPIILSCGIAAQSFREAALRFAATHIVEKPILSTELQVTVASLIEQQRLVADRVGEKLLEYHSQQLDVREPVHSDSDKDKHFIVRFNDMMSENFSNDQFTREIAAKHMNVCLRTLNRRLNEHYSHNFKEHLKKYRLERAKELLTQGYTINEASLEVGFSSASYFSTCFKAEYGFAPSRLVMHSA